MFSRAVLSVALLLLSSGLSFADPPVSPFPLSKFGTSCPPALPLLPVEEKVGDACNHLNDLAAHGGVTLEFSAAGNGIVFSFDLSGSVWISGKIVTVTPNGKVGNSKAIYQFQLRDVDKISDRIKCRSAHGSCVTVFMDPNSVYRVDGFGLAGTQIGDALKTLEEVRVYLGGQN